MRFVLEDEATAAQRRVYFQLVDGTDGITAETGEAAGQPQISTNGGAWTNTGIGTLTHIGNGRYYADLTAAAVGTTGDWIETRFKSANTAEAFGDSVHVINTDIFNAGAVASVSGAVGSVTGAVGSVTGAVGSVTGAVGSVTGAVGSVTANVNADVVAVSGDTTAADNLELQYDGTGLTGDTFPATQASTAPTAAAIADQVWLEPIADHSGTSGSTAESLASASSATGSTSITIHIEDASNVAIQGAKVSVYDTNNTSLQTVGTTDSAGDFALSLDDATYKLRIVLGGWSFTDPETMIVSGNATHTFTGTDISVGSPASPTGCMVYGTLMAGTSAHASVTVKMYEVTNPPQEVGDNIMSGLLKTTTTDSNGYFEIEMAQSSKIVVEIPEAGIQHIVAVPATTSYDVSEEF